MTLQQLVLNFIVPLLGLLLVYKIIMRFIVRALEKSSLTEKIRGKIITYIRICFRVIIISGFVILADKLLGDEVVKYFLLVFRVLNEPVFVAGSTSISVLTIVLMIPVFFFASWAGKLVSKVIDTSSIDLYSDESSKRFTIAKLVRYGATVLTLLIGLSIIGIDLSSIAVLFGVLGIGLGFGLQNLVANPVCGICYCNNTADQGRGPYYGSAEPGGNYQDKYYFNCCNDTYERDNHCSQFASYF